MKHEWENEIVQMTTNCFEEIEVDLPDEFVVLGIAVSNIENGEACFIHQPRFKVKADVCAADCWQDVGADVEELRLEAMNYDK